MNVKHPERRNWKVLYTAYTGVQRRAVELITREVGAYILRDPGVYCVNVLPVWPLSTQKTITTNAIVLGTYTSDPIFAAYLKREEVPTDGFAVCITDNPGAADTKLVLICGDTDAAVFYGATYFLDDYLPSLARARGQYFPMEPFERALPKHRYSSAPVSAVRSLFTWGHPINNYRKTLETLARLRFNQIIVWNDYLPINADEFVEYAHSFGISVIWGFAWGWSQNCLSADVGALDELKAQVLDTYRTIYRGKGDGIYFQSFTETSADTIQGKLIAKIVTEFVNDTARALLEEEPQLLIEFGLHATSVKTHAEYLAELDPRVQIIWEDCGTFPHSHTFDARPEAKKNVIDFCRLILAQRPDVPTGIVFKGMLIQDWPVFQHQEGPFIMGDSAEEVVHHDMEQFIPMMRQYQAQWMTMGDFVRESMEDIVDHATAPLHLCVASHIADTAWYPLALCAEMMWDPKRPYEQIVHTVACRRYVHMT